jgi:hypothetical protein
MFDDQWSPRLVDFGFGSERRVSPAPMRMETQYIAPELSDLGPGQIPDIADLGKADIFAFGMLLYEVVTGLPCFPRGYREDQIAMAILRGKRPVFPPGCRVSELTLGICEHCWAEDPDTRPEFYHIVIALLGADDPPFEGTQVDEYRTYMTEVFGETAQSPEAEDALRTDPEPAILDLILAGTAYPVQETVVAELLEHRGEVREAKSYAVQSGVPVGIFEVFVDSLRSGKRLVITQENAGPVSLLAKEFFLADLESDCAAVFEADDPLSLLAIRVAKLERQVSALTKRNENR